MKLKVIINLIADAYKKDMDEKLWQQYLIDRIKMDSKETFKTYEEYKKMVTGTVRSNTKADVATILLEAEKIKQMDEACRKGGIKNEAV